MCQWYMSGTEHPAGIKKQGQQITAIPVFVLEKITLCDRS